MSVRRIALAALIVAIASVAPLSGAFASDEWRTIDHDGMERRYLIHTPEAGASALRAAVIVLHGGGGDAENAVRMTGFSEKADKEGFIAVYPNGSSKRFDNKLLTWNARHCCAAAMKQNVDDVGFISALIDEVVERDGVDPGRVYVTGMSNGAMMAHRLGVALPDKVAAIAPVVGGLFGDEKVPATPVAALIINGGEDEMVPLAGGVHQGRRARAWDGAPLEPAAYQGAFWARANDCAPTPLMEEPSPELVRWTYQCPGGAGVVRYVVKDGGHAWPGGEKGRRAGDKPSESLDAIDVIWRFFNTHRR